ncbi:MAG: hypothetical protein HY078_01820 [Elusimicrobia bacterium]|nr:hypothetical protein [Elusimicrobiota bacterium]
MISHGMFIAGACLVLSACTGELVETRRRVKGPVSSVPWIDAGGGHARYSLRGYGFMRNDRREDVLGKISAYCGGDGKYKIVDEVDREEAETSFRSEGVERALEEGGTHYRKARYHHLYFECVP